LGHVRIALDGDSRYTESAPAPGIEVVREAVARWENTTIDRVVLTTGASMAIVSALASLPRPGSVLCPLPYYPAYPKVAALLGLGVVHYPLDPGLGWLPDPRALDACVRPDTRALLWNFPGNPSGSVVTSEIVEGVASVVREHGLLVISDDVYRDFMYDGATTADLGSMVDDSSLVRVRSFSKAFGLAAERLGYAIAHPRRAAEIAAAHWSLAMSAPGTGQALAYARLRNEPDRRVSALRAILRANRDAALEILGRAKRLVVPRPSAGIFFWIQVPDAADSRELARRCAEDAGVVVVPGAAFGIEEPTYLRVCFAVPSDVLVKGVNALVDFVEGR
jgi:aspartate/methionine/tyrosine aminotransferase